MTAAQRDADNRLSDLEGDEISLKNMLKRNRREQRRILKEMATR